MLNCVARRHPAREGLYEAMGQGAMVRHNSVVGSTCFAVDAGFDAFEVPMHFADEQGVHRFAWDAVAESNAVQQCLLLVGCLAQAASQVVQGFEDIGSVVNLEASMAHYWHAVTGAAR